VLVYIQSINFNNPYLTLSALSRRYVSDYCKYILYLSLNENRSFLKSMLLNHTKPITKQEERKRAAQRLLYFPPAKGGKG